MKIALAQTAIVFENIEKNLAVAQEWIASAAHEGTDIIFFPEMSFTGFSMNALKIETYTAQTISTMCDMARHCHLAIGFGCARCNAQGKIGNHYLIVDATGTIILDYTKLHPFSLTGEEKHYTAGEDIAMTRLGEMAISVFLCYDLRFPEVFRLVAQKASLVVVPANWLSRRANQWQILLQSRAIENEVYVLGINCVGEQGENIFLGGSCAVNPEGKVLLSCGDKVALRYVTIDDDAIQYRQDFPVLDDARWTWVARRYGDMFL